jgi:hypothetical protein
MFIRFPSVPREVRLPVPLSSNTTNELGRVEMQILTHALSYYDSVPSNGPRVATCGCFLP